MLKKIGFAAVMVLCAFASRAQYESYVQVGEIGLGIGGAHYYGDLNTNSDISKPKIALSAFFLKQINPYVGIKAQLTYAQLGYSDVYSKNIVQQRRNLSFNTDIWETSVTGYFNFFKFLPGVEGYNYTPYVSIGGGIFTYDPYTYYRGQKYMLREIGTEGQGSDNAAYANRKPYKSYAFSAPIAVGFKYAITRGLNIYAEACYRFTSTDFLDDVSGATYAPDAFEPNSIGYFLQDRSYETGERIGIKGRQRGNSKATDAFASVQIGISFNIASYKCPEYD